MILVIILISIVVATLQTQEGYVLEYGTNKPLKDVYVVAKWRGVTGIVDNVSVCYHMASTQTNENGYFMLPKFSMKLRSFFLADNYSYLYFFKPGYTEYPGYKEQDEYRKKEYVPGIWHMKKFIGNTEKRFEYFKSLPPALLCTGAGKSLKNAYPLYEAVVYEAKRLANTEDQKQTVEWLRRIAARAAVMPSVNYDMRETEKGIEQFLQDNLK